MGKVRIVFAAALVALGVVALTRIEGRSAPPDTEAPHAKAVAVAKNHGGRVAGAVTRAGKGVAARIEVRPRAPADPIDERLSAVLPDGDPVAAADAGTDGTFAVAGLAPGSYEVHAVVDGVAAASAATEILDRRQTVRVDLPLPAGGETLRGRAVRPDGTPFVGEIRLYEDLWYEDPVATRSGADGSFEFRGLEPGVRSLAAAEPGRRFAAGPSLRLPRPEAVDFVVGEGAAPLAGRVLDAADDRPIADAVVTAEADGMTVRTISDADGRYATSVPETDRRIWIRAPGYGLARVLAPEGPAESVVRLRRAGRVSGRVVDAGDGRPVGGIEVRTLRGDGEPGFVATTDAEGRFAFAEVPFGDFVLVARGGGRSTAEVHRPRPYEPAPAALRVAPGETREMELPVEVAVRIEGRAVDAAGAAVAGTVVRAGPAGEEEPGDLGAVAVTDEAGRFAFDDVPARTPWRVVAADGSPAVEPLVGEPGETIRVDVRLVPPAPAVVPALAAPVEGKTIAGMVVGPDGAPVEAAVFVRPLDAGEESRGWRTGSVSDGTFVLEGLPPGRYRLSAEAPLREMVAVDADAGDESVRIELGPERAPAGPLVLRVLGPDGRPVPEATARLRSALQRDWAATATVRRGEVRFEWWGRADAVRVLVYDARTPQGLPLPAAPTLANLLAGPGSAAEVRLAPERTIAGRVVDAEGGPRPGVPVVAVPLDGELAPTIARARTGPDGSFVLRGLAEGEYRLRAYAGPGVLATHRPARAGDATVEIRLPPTRTARIVVVDGNHSPVRSAEVSMRWTGIPGERRADSLRGRTDQRGVFRAIGLPATGEVELFIEPEAPARDYRDGRFEPHDATIRLATGPGFSVEVEAVGAPSPWQPWSARLVDAATGQVLASEIERVSDSVVRFGDLPRGTRVDLYQGPIGADGYLLLRGLDADPRRVRAEVREGTSLEVRLRLPAGARRPEVVVSGPGFSTRAVDRGAFVARGLPPGPWTVTARADVDGRTVSRSATVAAGPVVEVDLTGGR